MNRGTVVAQAYIALTADGSNIDDDIADAFDEVDWDEIGERTSKKYSKALRKNLERDLGQSFEKTVGEKVAKAIEHDEAMRKSVRSMVDKAHNNAELDALYRHVARRAGGEYSGEFGKTVERLVKRDLREALYRASQQPGVRDHLDSILSRYASDPDGKGETIYRLGPAIESSIRKAEKVLKDSHRRQTKDYVDFWENALKEREVAENALSRVVQKTVENRVRMVERSNEAIRDSDERLVKEQEALRDQIIKSALADQERWLNEHDKAVRQEVRDREAGEKAKIQFLNRYHNARRQMLDTAAREEAAYIARTTAMWERANAQFAESFYKRKRLREEEARQRREADRAFEETAKRAQELLSNIRFDPKIDRATIDRFERDLRARLARRRDLTLQLEGDLSERERDKIAGQIADIDTKLRLEVDQNHLNRSLLKAQGLIDRAGRRIDAQRIMGRTIADRMGRLTGMGARNNFLNLVGRTIRTVTNLSFGAIRGISALTRGALEMGKAFQTGFQSASEGASVFARAGAGMAAVGARLAPMFASMAAGLPALAVGLVAVGVAMVALTFIASALTSMISALLGVVFALAGTLVSGLTAALMVVGAAFVPVIASVGLLTAAFMSMDDEQKKYMAETFEPLREGFVGIGQIILEQLIPAFETWSENLQRFGAMILPLARTIGQSFADAGNTITEALTGPGFQKLTVALGQHLPQIVKSLSSAFGDFLNGLSGMFAALMPFVERFADYLAEVAERFSKWANSAEGQNSIVDFTERAWESLKSLWNFMREFFGWLRDIFFNPTVQDFGNKMFDGLADSFRRLRDNIEDGSLERWMKDAERLGRQLWDTFTDLWDIFKTLNNSKVIEIVGQAFEILGWVFRRVNDILEGFVDLMNGDLPDSLLGKALMFNPIISALNTIRNLIDLVMEGFKRLSEANFKMPGLLGRGLDLLGLGPSGGGVLGIGGGGGGPSRSPIRSLGELLSLGGGTLGISSGVIGGLRGGTNVTPTLDSLFGDDWPEVRRRGRDTLSRTDVDDPTSSSSSRKDPSRTPTFQWINPYKEWAESLIKEGPTVTKQINDALKEMGKEVNKALNEVMTADTGAEARQGLANIRQRLRQQGKDLRDLAQDSLNSAARSLANVTDPAELPAALAAVKRAQQAVKNAQTAQRRLNKVAKELNQQRRINAANVRRLINGERVANATLAEYARARERLANRIDRANEKLNEAISTRNQYAQQVTQSIRAFGSLMTAQAQEVDGVEQALTHRDITENLQDRLNRIRSFQQGLIQLRAMGLGDAAYKEILDAGVEEGAAFVDALLEGGIGAIDTTNKLMDEIERVSHNMGIGTSRYLYQAGVDSAQGLVDGLLAADRRVESAAKHLGEKILSGIKFSLGIASPAKRLIDEMDHVGDGTVIGLRNQHRKVGAASSDLADIILRGTSAGAVQAPENSPSAAVSGNSTEHHWHITTPSENPRTVALEMMNEVVGRL